MCDGNPSVLISQDGQILDSKDTNSHSKLAEKYFGDSRLEDNCFQPELDLQHCKICVNKEIELRMGRTKEITITEANVILNYFNKNYNSVAKLRTAILKTKNKKKQLDGGYSSWWYVWNGFKYVLKESVVNTLYGLNDENRMKEMLNLSKNINNLNYPWNTKNFKFKLSDILDKSSKKCLFA